MRLHNFLNESTVFTNTLNKLKGMTYKKLESFLKDQFAEFVSAVQSSGLEREVVTIINNGFDTRYKDFNDIKRQRVPKLREDKDLNESLSHWWDTVKSEGFPTLAFYPALQVWLEIDKYLRGQGLDIRLISIYSAFWLLLVSGKYVKGWMHWKKQNPEEYEKERAEGKGGII